jgi:hypothetical protein
VPTGQGLPTSLVQRSMRSLITRWKLKVGTALQIEGKICEEALSSEEQV